MINGLINVYKEPSYTSFDVVAVLRKILKQKKIGHTGTLDPDAEGTLLVCLGNATKLCDMLEDRTKEYKCKMLLGCETDTEDTSGKVLKQSEVNAREEAIKEAILSFEGEIMQIPPMYSALKVNGKKLYEYAREGIEIERKARPITIFKITVDSIEVPYVTFTVSCSKGTYIRSLCRDIGNKLGTGACMAHLQRTRVSNFCVEDSLRLDDIRHLYDEGNLEQKIIPVERVFDSLRILHVQTIGKKYIDNGNKLMLSDTDIENVTDGEEFRVHNVEDQFVAIYKYNAEDKLLVPVKMFIPL